MRKVAFSIAALGVAAFSMLSCGGGGGGSSSSVSAATGPCNPQQDSRCHSVTVNGVTRTYLLHVPSGFQANSGALVIALHGRGGNAAEMESLSGLSAKADQAGFAVAYPDGLPQGGLQDWAMFFNAFTDDVGFLRALIAELQSTLHNDPKKVYITGFSDGARMAHRAAIQLSEVAAVGAVGGGLFAGTGTVPAASTPVSVIILQGDQDVFCGNPTTGTASQETTFNYWTSTAGNACSTVDTATALCDATGAATSVTEKDATGCRAGAEVQLFKLLGGQHNWYTMPMNLSGQTPFNPNLNAATGVNTDDILWNFFQRHAKP
jgi:polyhydroxybutyrate depolymerase